MIGIELFAGCGGLALGIAEAGFKHALVVERDPAAFATLLENKKRGIRHLADWELAGVDARDVDYTGFRNVDLVTGGPPCQPFSIAGVHRGPGDPRNMWQEAIRAVRELRPRAFLFENVRGLLRPSFERYLRFLRLQLSWPEIGGCGIGWREQLSSLARRARSGPIPSYSVVIQGVNAADYGASQQRHRVVVMGIRSDVSSEAKLPAATHSREALVWEQRVAKEYWLRHEISVRRRPQITESDAWVLKRLLRRPGRPAQLPWRTVRDAIADLPRPTQFGERVQNHRLHPGARIYPGHTGSVWDEPAKALKAGDHGVPGGENMLVTGTGKVRYFTIREMARLQGFPDDFHVGGTWMSPIKQLGNAVPVQMARTLGKAVRELLRDVQNDRQVSRGFKAA